MLIFIHFFSATYIIYQIRYLFFRINMKTAFHIWTASSEFGTYRLCEQRRFRRACASAQSRQNLRCSLIQVVSQEEPSDRKPDPWPLWMAGHAQLKFVMTECSKTQIRLTGLIYLSSEYQVSQWFILTHSESNKCMSLVMRKPVYALCEQQKRRSAFVVRCLDSIIPLVSISEISSLYPTSVDAQIGSSLPWSKTPKTGFLTTRLILW